MAQNRKRHLTTAILVAALLLLAIAPAATAAEGPPLRAQGTADFVVDHWEYTFTGDIEGTAVAVVPSLRLTGPEDSWFIHGTMHWSETMVITTLDGSTITIDSDGVWSFANGEFRVNGVVTAATGTHSHLVGATVHQLGHVDPAIDPLSGTLTLRIN